LWPVKIDSNPPGAKCDVKTPEGALVFSGLTPLSTVLSAKKGYFKSANYNITFEKEGYTQASAVLAGRLNEWYIGNIVFGGLIGLCIVDPLTGAMWKLDGAVYGNLSPDPNYTKKDSTVPHDVGPRQTSDIAAKLQELKDLKEKGLLTDEEFQIRRKTLVDKL
jgi:Short C-terminal domain